jgi:hypothetical protein
MARLMPGLNAAEKLLSRPKRLNRFSVLSTSEFAGGKDCAVPEGSGVIAIAYVSQFSFVLRLSLSRNFVNLFFAATIFHGAVVEPSIVLSS